MDGAAVVRVVCSTAGTVVDGREVRLLSWPSRPRKRFPFSFGTPPAVTLRPRPPLASLSLLALLALVAFASSDGGGRPS